MTRDTAPAAPRMTLDQLIAALNRGTPPAPLAR